MFTAGAAASNLDGFFFFFMHHTAITIRIIQIITVIIKMQVRETFSGEQGDKERRVFGVFWTELQQNSNRTLEAI